MSDEDCEKLHEQYRAFVDKMHEIAGTDELATLRAELAQATRAREKAEAERDAQRLRGDTWMMQANAQSALLEVFQNPGAEAIEAEREAKIEQLEQQNAELAAQVAESQAVNAKMREALESIKSDVFNNEGKVTGRSQRLGQLALETKSDYALRALKLEVAEKAAKLALRAHDDPGWFTPRGDNFNELLHHWQRRAWEIAKQQLEGEA